MTQKATRPPRLVPGNGLADVHSSPALDIVKNSVSDTIRQDPLAAIEAALLGALEEVRRARSNAIAAEPRRLLPIKQAAEHLGVEVRTVWKRAKLGAGIYRNGRWEIDVDAAEAIGRQRKGRKP